MALIDKKSPHEVSTATTTAFGLVGGYLTAVQTGIRPSVV
jgi:conserved integral membrane protein